MKVVRGKKKKWFVVDVEPYLVDGEEHTSYGPYDTRAEARDVMRGLERFDLAYSRSKRVAAMFAASG